MYIISGDRCIACGTLPRDAALQKVGAKQSSKTKFGIKIDEIGEKKEAKWLDCVCWYKLALYAAGLEKGDTVLVAGKLREYNYTSKKTGEAVHGMELVCEFVMPQGVAEVTQDFSEEAEYPEVDVSDSELPF